MSQSIEDQNEDLLPGYNQNDLERYLQANLEAESNRHYIAESKQKIAELEQTEAVELFQKQAALLQKHLVSDPQFFQQMFIDDGTRAIVWEFQQDKLSKKFTRAFWDLLLRNDDMSTLLLRFIWNLPLKSKRKFIRAIDKHLSDQYPMFKGLSKGWPGENNIPPYIRPPGERNQDFDLVNQDIIDRIIGGKAKSSGFGSPIRF